MTQDARRQEAVEAILRLVPPRNGVEFSAARDNLERLDNAALEALRADLADTAPSEARCSPGLGRRRERTRAKLVSGFTKLADATRRLEAYDKARERQPTPASAQRPSPSRSRAARGAARRDEATVADAWDQPPLIEALALRRPERSSPLAAGAVMTTEPSSLATIAVPADGNVLAVDKIQSLLSRQLASIFEQVDEDHASQIGDLFEAVLKDPVSEKYLRFHLTAMVRDIVTIALERRLSTVMQPQFSSIYQHLQGFLRTPSAAVGTEFLSNRGDVISETTAIEGFAKMVVRSREYDPQCVVVIDGSGEIAGELVRRTYEGGAHFAVLNRHTDRLDLPPGLASGTTRVLVIDDIARTGQTMRRTFERCRSAFATASIRGMALVGTVESANALQDTAFFPTLWPDTVVRVPWNKEGGYRATDTDHVLGWGKPDSLSIGKNLLERTIFRAAYKIG